MGELLPHDFQRAMRTARERGRGAPEVATVGVIPAAGADEEAVRCPRLGGLEENLLGMPLEDVGLHAYSCVLDVPLTGRW